MLIMPEDSGTIISMIGIDPGTDTLGAAVLLIDINTLHIVSSNAMTYVGTKMISKTSWISHLHGARTDRILAHEENLLTLFLQYRPISIAAESPFINFRFPQAGLALTEVIAAIRRAVMQYDLWRQLILLDPPTVKNAVGAPGNAPKEIMRNRVMNLPDLNYSGEVPIEMLDEHSIDALAVAYCRYQNWLTELCLR